MVTVMQQTLQSLLLVRLKGCRKGDKAFEVIKATINDFLNLSNEHKIEVQVTFNQKEKRYEITPNNLTTAILMFGKEIPRKGLPELGIVETEKGIYRMERDVDGNPKASFYSCPSVSINLTVIL